MLPRKISVVLVEDETMTAAQTAFMLSETPEIHVLAIAQTAAHARTLLRALRPKVGLIDHRLPDGEGIALIGELAHELPDTRWIVLSAYSSIELMEEADSVGAHGIVDKVASGPEHLLEAIRRVAVGGDYYCPASAELLHFVLSQPENRLLSTRQRDILKRLARGETRPQIAAALDISQAAVTAQIARLCAKLGFSEPPAIPQIVQRAREVRELPRVPLA